METIERYGKIFAKLTVRDRLRIIEGLRTRGRDAILENLKAAGIAGPDAFATLNDYGEKRWTDRDFINHVNTSPGQEEVLLIAMRKTMNGKAEEAFETLDIPAVELLPFVAELCGLVIGEAPEETEKGEGGDEPDPTKGETTTKSDTPPSYGT